MKKLILTFITVVTFTFSAVASCPSYASTINTSCGSYCAYVQMELTGLLGPDVAIISAGDDQLRRPLSNYEYAIVSNALESQCD